MKEVEKNKTYTLINVLDELHSLGATLSGLNEDIRVDYTKDHKYMTWGSSLNNETTYWDNAMKILEIDETNVKEIITFLEEELNWRNYSNYPENTLEYKLSLEIDREMTNINNMFDKVDNNEKIKGDQLFNLQKELNKLKGYENVEYRYNDPTRYDFSKQMLKELEQLNLLEKLQTQTYDVVIEQYGTGAFFDNDYLNMSNVKIEDIADEVFNNFIMEQDNNVGALRVSIKPTAANIEQSEFIHLYDYYDNGEVILESNDLEKRIEKMLDNSEDFEYGDNQNEEIKNSKEKLKVFEGALKKVPTEQMFDDSLFGKLDLKKVTVEDTKRKSTNGEEYLLFRLSYKEEYHNDSVYKISPIIIAKGEEMNKLCKLGEYHPVKIETKETMVGEKLFYDVITVEDKLGKSYEEKVITKLKEDIQKDMLTNNISQFRQYDSSVMRYNKKCLTEGYKFIYAPNGAFDIKKLDENHKVSKTINSDKINAEEKDMLMNYYTGKETIPFIATKFNASKEEVKNYIENLELKVDENFIIKKIHNKIKDINDKWNQNELERYNPLNFIKEGKNAEELNHGNIEEVPNDRITNYGLDITKIDLEVISVNACEKIINKLEDEQHLRKEKVYDNPQSKKQFQELINLFSDLGETKEIKEEKNNKNKQEAKIQI